MSGNGNGTTPGKEHTLHVSNVEKTEGSEMYTISTISLLGARFPVQTSFFFAKSAIGNNTRKQSDGKTIRSFVWQ